MNHWNLIVYSPAYNVEASIAELISRMSDVAKRLKMFGIMMQKFVVVNDGSTDKTSELLTNLKVFGFLEVIKKKKREGSVRAIFDGMKRALKLVEINNYNPKKTILIRMDSDLEHQPEDITKLVTPIIAGRTKVSVGYIPFDLRSGRTVKEFNERFGLEESRKFLGVDIPQFCPGFNAIRCDVFRGLSPKLEEKSKIFGRVYGEPMLSLDFVVLVLAKGIGEKINVVKLRFIEDDRIKKQPESKYSYYLDCHRKTMEFLEETV